ncbi:hypothetical protein MKW92_022295 [Papaver armeniacum]|nr:hypothetical protein MKW92_022295 [Papaver armeniacum]
MADSVGVQRAKGMLREVSFHRRYHANFCVTRASLYRDSLLLLAWDAERLYGGVKVKFFRLNTDKPYLLEPEAYLQEPATGNGVTAEWFRLVAEAFISDVRFEACESDGKKIFPNRGLEDADFAKYFAMSVEPWRHLGCLNAQDLALYRCFGRFIALALMHKVLVPIKLDRAFFTLLSGRELSIEDMQYAAPALYKTWSPILEGTEDYCAAIVDAGGIEFSDEEANSCVELRRDGSNRAEMVNMYIQKWTADRVEQVKWVSRGFGEMLFGVESSTENFFQSLTLEEFNLMLHGINEPLNIDDMKRNTEYEGCSSESKVIQWLWKAIEELSDDERQSLLHFWASLYNVSPKGFGGLDPKLKIALLKVSGDGAYIKSKTCFNLLQVPDYSTETEVVQNLRFILSLTGFSDV